MKDYGISFIQDLKKEKAVKKIKYLSFILFFSALCLNMMQGADQNDESIRKEYFNSKYQTVPNKDIKIEFSGDVFYLQWSLFNQNTTTLEFLRENETVENFKQMITVVTPGSSAAFDDFTASYLKLIKPLQVNEPMLLKNKESKFGNEIVIDALLLNEADDRVEHILAKIFTDEKKHVNCIVLSTRLKFSEVKANPDILTNEIGSKRVNWLNKLGEIYFITFP